MKKVLEKLKKVKFTNLIAAMALMVATVSANSACMLWFYQEEESDEVKKLRKF